MPPPKDIKDKITAGIGTRPNTSLLDGPHPGYLAGVLNKALDRDVTPAVLARPAIMVCLAVIKDMRLSNSISTDPLGQAAINKFLDDYQNALLKKAGSTGGGGADDEAILQGP